MSQKELRATLPRSIPYYSFSGDKVVYNGGKTCPGKEYLDRDDVLIRVTHANVSRNTGFCGQVVFVGLDIDCFTIGDVVVGGKTNCLQHFVLAKLHDIVPKPVGVNVADGALVYWAAAMHSITQTLETNMQVLVLGDSSGIAAQLARLRGCTVHTDDDQDIVGDVHVAREDPVAWLKEHRQVYDAVIDTYGRPTAFNDCAAYTSEYAEYFVVEPQATPVASVTMAAKRFWPTALGGGTRKLTVVRHPSGKARGVAMQNFLSYVTEKQLDFGRGEVVPWDNVSEVRPYDRIGTVIEVNRAVDIDDPNAVEGLRNHKNKEPRTPQRSRRSSASSGGRSPNMSTPNLLGSTPRTGRSGRPVLSRSPSSPSPGMFDYSPARPSGLSHSISAANLEALVEQEHDSRPGSATANGFGPQIRDNAIFDQTGSKPVLRRTSSAHSMGGSFRGLAIEPPPAAARSFGAPLSPSLSRRRSSVISLEGDPLADTTDGVADMIRRLASPRPSQSCSPMTSAPPSPTTQPTHNPLGISLAREAASTENLLAGDGNDDEPYADHDHDSGSHAAEEGVVRMRKTSLTPDGRELGIELSTLSPTSARDNRAQNGTAATTTASSTVATTPATVASTADEKVAAAVREAPEDLDAAKAKIAALEAQVQALLARKAD